MAEEGGASSSRSSSSRSVSEASEISSGEYNLFDSDSDLIPVDGEDEGPRPYRFEPRRIRRNVQEDDEADRASDESSDSEIERVGNTDWCRCGSCDVMPTSAESGCCREIDQVWRKVEDQRPEHDFPCITAHRGFSSTCLDVWVLETAFHAYVQQHGGGNHTGHERFRYIAYRQPVRWCWGYLGKHVRVALPSCAVNKIRETFSAEFPANYTGLKPPNLHL